MKDAKVKMNFRRYYETNECRACGTNEETQKMCMNDVNTYLDSNTEPNEKPKYI